MEAKTPSGPSPGLAQKGRPRSDHPLGRVLEPLGFYRHPVLYALFSNLSCYLLTRTVEVHTFSFRIFLSIYLRLSPILWCWFVPLLPLEYDVCFIALHVYLCDVGSGRSKACGGAQATRWACVARWENTGVCLLKQRMEERSGTRKYRMVWLMLWIDDLFSCYKRKK